MKETREQLATSVLLLGVVAMVGAMLLLPNPLVPIAIILAVFVFLILRHLPPIEIRAVVPLLMWTMILLDGDYNSRKVPTVFLCDLIFTQIVPSIPTVFEQIAGVLLFIILVKSFGRGANPAFRSKSYRALLAVGLTLIGVMVLAAAFGVGTGGEGRIAFWQIRSFPLFLIWSMIGFYSLRTIEEARRFFDQLVLAVFIKSLFNIVILWTYFGGHIGGKATGVEYLSSHIASFYMGTAILRLILRLSYEDKTARQRWWTCIQLLPILYIWVMNDRRVSFLGVTFVLLFSLGFLYPHIRRRHYYRGFYVFLLLLFFAAATWNNPGHSVKSLFVKEESTELDYRDIENYDLYRAVAERPITGRGYGYPFKQYMQLPDIFSLAEILSWIPHNNLLMIWSFSGPLGLAATATMIAFSLAIMVRLHRSTTRLDVRIFGFMGYAVLVQWTLFFWADMALAFSPSIFVPGIVSGFAYRLTSLRERGLTYG